jgi:hypothetical protein
MSCTERTLSPVMRATSGLRTRSAIIGPGTGRVRSGPTGHGASCLSEPNLLCTRSSNIFDAMQANVLLLGIVGAIFDTLG